MELRPAGGDRGAAAPRRLRGRPLLARGQAGAAQRSLRLHHHRDDGAPSDPAARGSAQALRRGRARALRGSARSSTTSASTSTHAVPRIVFLPGDGIGPEIGAAAARVLAEIGDFEITEHLIGGASIDEHGTALTDEVLEACRQADAVLLCAVGGPKWDTTDPGQAPPRTGPARPAQGARPVREPAPGPPERGAARGQPAAPRAHRGHRPAGRARAHRRHLLRRVGARRRPRPRRLRLHRGGDRADRPRRLRGGRRAQRPGHLGGQGERAGDVPPLARDGHQAGSRVRGDRARPPAGRQRRDAARLATRPGST